MAIAAWHLRIKWRRLVFAAALILLLIFLATPIQRGLLRLRIAEYMVHGEWAQVSKDLHRYRDLSASHTLSPTWFDQALSDLEHINSLAVDTQAQVQLIQWLEDEGEGVIAGLLLDQNRVLIEAGRFRMGSESHHDDERPSRLVTLSPFAIDRFEVTQLQYRRFVQDGGAPPPVYWDGDQYPTGMDLYPVVGVSWEHAQAYCEWAGKRLPTEAEWERSCRGDEGSIYPWGDVWVSKNANVGLSWSHAWPRRFDDAWPMLRSVRSPGLEPVGLRDAGYSPFGLADCIGNAAEWVWDWYDSAAYRELSDQDPIARGPEFNHVIRGNGWFSRLGWEEETREMSRCESRSGSHSFDDPRVGFRCATG